MEPAEDMSSTTPLGGAVVSARRHCWTGAAKWNPRKGARAMTRGRWTAGTKSSRSRLPSYRGPTAEGGEPNVAEPFDSD